MPRYFFHARVGNLSARDRTGIVMRDDIAAHQEAIQTLSELVRDERPAGIGADIRVGVTDAGGKSLFAVRLDFTRTTLH
jgi:hypothetical protein